MVYCPVCGKELSNDAVYCDKCGHKMSEPVSPTEGHRRNHFESRFERRFERVELRNLGPDHLDGLGFGVFLIGVAWVYLQYPWVWNEILIWFKTWVNGPTVLPVILAQPIVLFFLIMGGWGLIEAALRVVSGRVMQGLSDAVGATGSFAIAYMLRAYDQGLINGLSLLPYFIIIIGASIMLSAVIRSMNWSNPSLRRD